MAALKVSFYVYPLVNALHILSIGALVTTVIVMDLRILGWLRTMERGPLIGLMREIAGIAFTFAALSGIALFSIRAQEYATNPAFQAKLALLVLAGLNMIAFGRLAARGAGAGGDRMPARALAGLSIVLWVSVLVAGRFIGFI